MKNLRQYSNKFLLRMNKKNQLCDELHSPGTDEWEKVRAAYSAIASVSTKK